MYLSSISIRFSSGYSLAFLRCVFSDAFAGLASLPLGCGNQGAPTPTTPPPEEEAEEEVAAEVGVATSIDSRRIASVCPFGVWKVLSPPSALSVSRSIFLLLASSGWKPMAWRAFAMARLLFFFWAAAARARPFFFASFSSSGPSAPPPPPPAPPPSVDEAEGGASRAACCWASTFFSSRSRASSRTRSAASR